MKIHKVAQRSPEWYELRGRYFTASEIAPFCHADKACRLEKKDMQAILDGLEISYKKAATNAELEALIPDAGQYYDYGKVAKDSREGLINSKLGAVALLHSLKDANEYEARMIRDEIAPEFSSWPAKRGIMLEPVARSRYEEITGFGVDEVGFCSHESMMIGCSPDGLVGPDGGLEIKCLMPANHVALVRTGKVSDKHLCQVHTSLVVTGRVWWDFLAYCPGMPHRLIRFHRDKFTERLEQGLRDLCDEYQAARNQMAGIYDSQIPQPATA